MQTILIVDDDRAILEALAGWLECPGRGVVLCSDLESAELVVERGQLDCVITDIRLTGPFRFEGLDFIDHVRRLSRETRIVVMTGAQTEGLTDEALQRGADTVLRKPVPPEVLDAHLPARPDSREPASVVLVPAIEEIVGGSHLVPRFQPIVELSSTESPTVHGFESLARYEGAFFSNPVMLFEYANRTRRIVDLELACIRATLSHAKPLTLRAKVFINVHPAVISSGRLTDTLVREAETAGIASNRIVIEITEQGSLGESAVVATQCEALRDRGFAFALDDVGVAHSHLAHIEQIRPSYLKISQEFGTDFEKDATRSKIVRNVLSLAEDFDCKLILEGIETPETRDAATSLGIRFGQGYFFARPETASRLKDPA